MRWGGFCCIFWFAAAVVFAGVFGWAYQQQFGQYDVSGMVTCDINHQRCTFEENTIYAWSQHPDKPDVEKITQIPDGYDGKNYLLFEQGKKPVSGKIHIKDGNSFTVDSLAEFTRNGTTTVPLFATLDALSGGQYQFPPTPGL